MANIVISYDLFSPGKDYSKLIDAVKAINPHGWCHVHKSVWYVETNLSAADVRTYLQRFVDGKDSLFVVDATRNTAAWHNVKNPDYLKTHWERNLLK